MAKTKRDNKKGRLCTVRLNLKFQNEYLREVGATFENDTLVRE